MKYTIIACLLFAMPVANAAECGSTASRAGCVGPRGAVGAGPNGVGSYNRNTGKTHSSNQSNYNRVEPGTHKEGWRGNQGTKALEQGCAYVNGRRVCR